MQNKNIMEMFFDIKKKILLNHFNHEKSTHIYSAPASALFKLLDLNRECPGASDGNNREGNSGFGPVMA